MTDKVLAKLQVSVDITFPETGMTQIAATSTKQFFLTQEELDKLTMEAGRYVLQYWETLGN